MRPQRRSQLIERGRAMIDEVRSAFDLDSLVFYARHSTLPKALTTAALAHAAALLESTLDAWGRRDEMCVRVLGRAHFETCYTVLYLHWGGREAADRFIENYLDDTSRYHNALEAARKRSAKAADEPVSWEDLEKLGLTLDLSPTLNQLAGFERKRLSFEQLMKELRQLAVDAGEREADFLATYDLVYRGLSFLAGHPTGHVVGSYTREAGLYWKTAAASALTPMADTVAHSAIAQTAFAAERVLRPAGVPTELFEKAVRGYVATVRASRPKPSGG